LTDIGPAKNTLFDYFLYIFFSVFFFFADYNYLVFLHLLFDFSCSLLELWSDFFLDLQKKQVYIQKCMGIFTTKMEPIARIADFRVPPLFSYKFLIYCMAGCCYFFFIRVMKR